MNASFQLSLKKLDQVIGLPPPTLYSKHALHGSCTSKNLMNSFSFNKKPRLNKTLTSMHTFKNPAKDSAQLSPMDKLSADEKKQLYIARCKDLNIPPVPQLQKRYDEYLDRISGHRCLNLSENRLGAYAAEALAKILKVDYRFCRLELKKNSLCDKGVKILARCLHYNKTLVHIGLNNNEIRAGGANEFFKEVINHQSLISVDFSSREPLHKNRLGSAGVESLIELLKKNKFLSFLGLADTQIGAEGLSYISEGLKSNRTLEFLDISFNGLGSKPIKDLIPSLKLSNLSEINISGNKIGNEGAEALGDFLSRSSKQTSSLKTLYISHNEITYKGSNKLFYGLAQCTSLLTLHIDNNPLSELAGHNIFYCLEENNCLEHLNLTSCGLNETGIEKIANSLRNNRSLRVINFRNNQIKDSGLEFLAEALKINVGVLKLDVSMNCITNAGAVLLFNMIKVNSVLNIVNLSDNLLNDDVHEHIIECVYKKANFQILKLKENQFSTRSLQQIDATLAKNSGIHKEILSSHLKSEIFELNKLDFNLERIHRAITSQKKEKLFMIQEISRRNSEIELIRQDLNNQYEEIHKVFLSTSAIKESLNIALESLNYTLTMEKSKLTQQVTLLHRHLSEVSCEISELESKQFLLLPRVKRLSKTVGEEYDKLKEAKALADKQYKFQYSTLRLTKKKLLEMRAEREKLRHQDPGKDKKPCEDI